MVGMSVRMEYPRPDFVRAEWATLNGLWQFAFDDADDGLREAWFEPGAREKFDRQILVPFPFQSELSGIHDPSPHPVVWYRRVFDVPAAWMDRRVLLHFGAVDYTSDVWINGRHAGHNEGGYVPFTLDVTPFLRGPASNELVVRVVDRDSVLQPRGKQSAKRDPWACWYRRTTGIWQSVWLEPVSPSHIARVHLHPDLDSGVLSIDAYLSEWQPDLTISATVLFQGTEVGSVTEQIPERYGDFGDLEPLLLWQGRMRIPDARPWSPETPSLYYLRLELRRRSETLDVVQTYFGLRKVHVEHGRFMLNNRPYYLRMVLDQGFWRDGLYTAPSVDDIRRDVELTKQLGFNGARKHQKIEDPYYYYFADHLGLIVWAEMPSAYAFDSDGILRLYNEWGRAIIRHYNHPSIGAWVPLNESWGVDRMGRCDDDLVGKRQLHHAVGLYHFTKALDPTRPVISNDGWEHAKSDIITIHEYTEDAGDLARKCRAYLADKDSVPFSHGRAIHLPGYPYSGQPIIISEFGGIKLESPEAPGWGYGRPARTADEMIERIRKLVEAIKGIDEVCGYCYTQLTDVEQEVNGLLTYDRRPKVPLHQLASIFGS